MARVYVGNLPLDIRERELEELFDKYGRIRDIVVKGRQGDNPQRTCFAFVEYEDRRDAEDAVHYRDRYDFHGFRLRVEEAGGGRRGMDPRGGSGGGGRLARSDHAVCVSNLPRGTSWQDFKDFMRKAGNVIYTDTSDCDCAIAEFATADDAYKAVRMLDDTEFTSQRQQTAAYVRVAEGRHPRRGGDDRGSPRRSSPPRRSRSRSPRRRSCSPRRGRSGSPRGRSASPRRSGSRS